MSNNPMRSSVPRLGGNTRRGETLALPTARSYPTLLGGGAVRPAVRSAQLVVWCDAGRTPWARKPMGVSVGAASVTYVAPRDTVPP